MLRLLGKPQIKQQDAWQPLKLSKRLSLLFYLAYRSDWVSRDELIALYWPETSEQEARHNLRQHLYLAKKVSWANTLESEEEHLRFIFKTDVQAFQNAYHKSDWKEAIKHYKGYFLEGFTANDSGYQLWLELSRNELEQYFFEAVKQHANALTRTNASDVIGFLKDVLRTYPLQESVLQLALKSSAQTEQFQEGINLYETFRVLLKADLELEPSAETQRLVGLLREERKDFSQAVSLPIRTKAFIGREKELSDLDGLLSNPDCRLITLLAMGGMGKTALAFELARQESFPEGVFVTQLQTARTHLEAVSLMLSQLGIQENDKEAKAQLFEYFSNKTILLVMDNLEQLEDAAQFVHDLLSRSKHLNIVVTSRQPLNLSNEWIYPLSGLDLAESNTSIERYAASQLFIQSARRLKANYKASRTDLNAIAAICQYLGGIPLALELAAAWMSFLDPEDILRQIKLDLGVLATDWHDIPERQRSLQSILEYSWSQMTPKEQKSAKKLALFADGFTTKTAQLVARVLLPNFLRLKQKALLNVSHKRFFFHESVRQFLLSKLEAQERVVLEKDYQTYFAAFIQQTESESQTDWLERLSAEKNNIHDSLALAIEQKNTELAFLLATRLSRFWDIKGHIFQARQFIKQILLLEDKASYPEYLAEILYRAGGFAWLQSDYATAKIYLADALERFETLSNPLGIGDCHNVLACIHHELEEFGSAKQAFKKSLAAFNVAKDDQGVAVINNHLGVLAQDTKDFTEAESYYKKALELHKEIKNESGVGVLLSNLGALAFMQDHLELAKEYFLESLSIRNKLGDKNGRANLLSHLAYLNVQTKNFHQAKPYFKEALELSFDTYHQRYLLLTLERMVELVLINDPKLAALLYFGCQSVRSKHVVIVSPSDLLNDSSSLIREALDQEHLERIQQKADTLSLEDLYLKALSFLG